MQAALGEWGGDVKKGKERGAIGNASIWITLELSGGLGTV